MPKDLRVATGPAALRGKPITLRLDGRAIRAFEGETVGAALHAAGERVLMRSIKYHRPRGLFCCTGKCAGCLMRVDGTPNVRACVTPAHDGMVVETQNAFPSARRDLFAVVDKAYPRVLDVHEQLARAPLLRPIHHAIVRRMAGFGKLPDLKPVPPRRPAIRPLEADVLVAGGGPSGLAAALAAAEAGARVALVDEGDRVGGSLLLTSDDEGRHGAARAEETLQRLRAAGATVLPRSVVFGLYGTDGHGDALPAPGLAAILTPERILECSPRTVIVASGAHETPPLFPGNDLPGVMGARAALILLHRHGVLAGERILVSGESAWRRAAADDLAKAGAEIVSAPGARVAEARGGRRVESVALSKGEETWSEEVDCVLAAGNETPRVELVQQAGGRLVAQGWALAPEGERAAPRVFACGSVLGPATLAERLAQGARVGREAAR